MGALYIFGLKWPIVNGNGGYAVQPPTDLFAGDSASIKDPLLIDVTAPVTLRGRVALRLQGLPIELTFEDLRLRQDGQDFRPAPGADGARAVLTMDGPSGQRCLRIGPAIIDEFGVRDFEADGRAAALIGSAADLLSGNPDSVRSPLSVMIGIDKTVVIDLGKRHVRVPAGALEATLSALGATTADRKAASFANDAPITIDFAEIAKSKAQLFELRLASGAVPLNVPARPSAIGGAYPPAPIEASECRLQLQLTSTGKPGSLLSAAALVPRSGGATSLVLQGLRNGRNRAERWSTTDPLPIGFRLRSKDGGWSTPLLAPVPTEAGPKMQRRDDMADGRVVPLHGWFGASQFRPEVAGITADMICARDAVIDPVDLIPSIDRKLQFHATRPWLRFTQTRFHHSRPGETYRGEDSSFVFETTAGYCGGAPMLARSVWEAGQTVSAGRGSSALERANDAVNAAFGAMVLQSKASVHETGLGDRTNGPGQPQTEVPTILAVIPDARVPVGSLQLQEHERRLDMASPRLASARIKDGKEQALAQTAALTLPIAVPGKAAPEYAVLWPDQKGRPWVDLTGFEQWAREISGAIDPAAPIAIGDLLADFNSNGRPKDFPIAILKIGRRLTLGGVLAEIADALPDGAKVAFNAKRKRLLDGPASPISATDPAIAREEWVGLIVFDAPIDFEAFPLLKAIVPTGRDAPRLSFVAIAPREAGKADADIAISAAVDWENGRQPDPVPADQTEEASFEPKSLSVGFRDRRMIRFQARAELAFYSFFGIKPADGDKPRPINIVGSAKRVAGSGGNDGAFEIRFAAEVPDGDRLVLFPVDRPVENAEATFLESAWLKRVEVIDAPGNDGRRKAEIEMDGAIKFRKPKFTGADLDGFFNSLRAVDFSRLRIDLPDISGSAPRLLKLRYPSLNFNLDLPHIALLGDALKLKFRQIALDWEPGFNAFDLRNFISLPVPGTGPLDFKLPKILFVGRLDFGSLPDLFARSLSGFALDGLFGLNIDRGKFLPEFKPYIGIGGFGFRGLDLDLMSFIKLRIDNISLGRAPWGTKASGAALHIKNASLEVAGIPVLEKGSGAFFSQDQDAGNGFWAAFRGYDFSFFKLDWGFVGQNIDFPSSIPKALLAPPPEKTSPEDFAGLSNTINDAWCNGEIVPAKTGGKGWTFAASVQALGGAFRGQALFQDGGFAGLSLSGPALKQLLNWDFAFTGIYRKNITPGEDYFYFSVTLPAMTFGGVRYTGGEIAAEIYTSGDFMADLGFPWRAPGGGRRWERTIGAIVTPGQASGGWYVRKRRSHRPDTQGKELTISGGVAVQWGLGAAFGGGVFEVWVRIGVYAIVEGSVTLEYSSSSAKIVAFMLQGAAGILVEGEGKIDWWVISVRVGVRASAEIRAALIWRGKGPVLMPIEAELSVSAYAEACIGGGCARICRGIEVRVGIPVRYQLKFG